MRRGKFRAKKGMEIMGEGRNGERGLKEEMAVIEYKEMKIVNEVTDLGNREREK